MSFSVPGSKIKAKKH